MADNQETVSNVPFYSSSDNLPGSWSARLNNGFDLYDLFSNPDKSDEGDPDLILSTLINRSDYLSVSKLNKVINEYGSPTFTILHCNIRSLSKNFNLIEEMLRTLDSKSDIIGVTETKLNEFSVANVDIESYNFYHTDSPTNAGGAALYINNSLKTIPRPDIKFDMNLVESCWAHIDNGKNKNQ